MTKKKNKTKLFFVVTILVIIIATIYLALENSKKEYQILEITEFKYFSMVVNNKVGAIDRKGNIVIPPEYDSIKIPNPSTDLFICTKNNNTEVLNEKKEVLFENYELVDAITLKGIRSDAPFEKSVLTYKESDKYGIINFEGKKLTRAIYDKIEGLIGKEGELIVTKNGKCGVININGKKIIDCKYDEVIGDSSLKNLGYIVLKDNNYGYINKLKKININPEYSSIERITKIDKEDIYLIISKEDKKGIIKNTDILLDMRYDSIESTNDMLKIKENGLLGLLSISGNVVLESKYSNITIQGEYINATENNINKVFDFQGNIIEAEYTVKIPVKDENHYIVCNKDGRYGVIDKNDNTIISFSYTYIEHLKSNNFIVRQEDKFGIVNLKDGMIVSTIYDGIQKNVNINVIIATSLENKTICLFKKDGQEIISLSNATLDIKNEYIYLYSNEVKKYYDLEGNELKSSNVYKNNTLFANFKNGKWGFVDKEGNIVIEHKYEDVTEYNEYGFAGIKINGKWGVIDSDKNIVINETYELNYEPEFIGKYYRVRTAIEQRIYTDRI